MVINEGSQKQNALNFDIIMIYYKRTRIRTITESFKFNIGTPRVPRLPSKDTALYHLSLKQCLFAVLTTALFIEHEISLGLCLL